MVSTTALNIRNVPDAVIAEFNRGAEIRRITQAQYLARLVGLHEFARALAATSPALADALAGLGLATVQERAGEGVHWCSVHQVMEPDAVWCQDSEHRQPAARVTANQDVMP